MLSSVTDKHKEPAEPFLQQFTNFRLAIAASTFANCKQFCRKPNNSSSKHERQTRWSIKVIKASV